jgi:hypothetical protein
MSYRQEGNKLSEPSQWETRHHSLLEHVDDKLRAATRAQSRARLRGNEEAAYPSLPVPQEQHQYPMAETMRDKKDRQKISTGTSKSCLRSI